MSNKCEHCGKEMVPGIPGDVYCPNDECFQKNFQKGMQMVREMRERKIREDYERLEEKYKTDSNDRG